ncbi:MAG: ABC transporter permease subunit [Xanthobacteraceae bacterium]|nr:ABC transporter permease subunit [Xanthobacteraceae bacterium]MCW5678494.1 ABC transporter permease subunit [Xanthobacteraceae bacterium]
MALDRRGIFNKVTVAVPFLWLAAFFLLPFLIVFKISLSDDAVAQPPYAPVFHFSEGWAAIRDKLALLDLDNYAFVLGDWLYVYSYLQSVVLAAIATVILVIAGYPVAYAIARSPRGWRPILLLLVVLPFFTSFLIRVYAWIGILSREGLLNELLLSLGVISTPLEILSTNVAVVIGMVYSYFPFMVLPLYAALEKMDDSLLEAAADLGATPARAFWRVTVPVSMPGIVAGALLCFIPAVGEFVIPDLLGGSDTQMIGRTVWNEFAINRSWTVSSALAILILLVLLVPILIYQRMQLRELEHD